MADTITTGLELRTLIADAGGGAPGAGRLELSLMAAPVPGPGPGEVLVRIEGAPVNPSDLGLLVGPADLGTLRAEETAGRPVLVADVPARRLAGVTARLGQSMPAGNEGAGTVVAAGPGAEPLVGRTVAFLGGAMFAQYRIAKAAACLVLPEGTRASDGASAYVNPLTALSMVEVMRREGHGGLVHTAAASNLGQMLNRIAQADGVPLVNIVRSPAQVALLRGAGAEHVLDSTAEGFRAALVDAVAATGATLAFDAVGGGPLAGHILGAMEAALARGGGTYSRYGSTIRKQVYVYGVLDAGETRIGRDAGFAWSVGGWLLTSFLGSVPAEVAAAMRARVAAELTTTFASRYTAEVSLAGLLDPETFAACARRATGEKYLVNPALRPE